MIATIVCQTCAYTALSDDALTSGAVTYPGGTEPFKCKVDGMLDISECPNLEKAALAAAHRGFERSVTRARDGMAMHPLVDSQALLSDPTQDGA